MSPSDDSDRRIVRLLPNRGTAEADDAPVVRRHYEYGQCEHVTGYSGQAIIDESRGTVTCGQCGVVLDPWAVLVAIARHYKARIADPLKALRVANQTYNENERRKFFNRVERHRSTHPKYVGTCRTCQRLQDEASRWAVKRLDEVRG